MQRLVTCRSLGALCLLLCLTACRFNQNSTAGATPAPSAMSLAQANSTAAPDQSLTVAPADKYFAKVSPSTHGITFSVWANGRPVIGGLTAGQSMDITPGMRGHTNRIAVQWQRRAKNGSGTLTIGTAKKAAMTVRVGADSPAKGQTTRTFIAPQAPAGR